MREITVNKNDAGQRLDRFAEKAVPLLPSSLCQKYIRLKRIKVNSRPVQRNYRLCEGDVISLYINDEFFRPPREDNAYLAVTRPELNIVYEDENILLADKRPGVLCHAAEGADVFHTLIANIQAYLYLKGEWDPKAENSFAPALCNRIDRNTGGIVIAAKTASALRILNEKIRLREIDKYYLCAVIGAPSPPSGELSGYIFKDASKNRVYVRKEREAGSRTAVTRYRTLSVSGSLSLLECRLLTGRTHQIRAQLAAAGHPLLGDGKYGGISSRGSAEKYQALYSYRVVFDFPTHAGELEYLRGKSFTVEKVDFVEKYFPGYDFH
ncbi:MAG: RluA family pseudouridine synthase [Oscillospiraceae bacterium]|nr:RluA family pseudouridine synthase [Oscillospiraceae bacterium]